MSAPPSGAKKQVLIVEDSIEEVFLMRSFLEKGGQYHVTTAQDGDAAERLIKSKDFDLVVTDLNLPGKDGYEVIRLVKAKNKRIPVLATTGYTATHLIEAAHRAGADHVMNKPLDRDEFLKEVAELLGAAAPAVAEKPTVLAIGALPGDIEGGSGGTLIGALSTGHSVLLLPLSARLDASDVLAEAQKRSAERMGARTITTGSSVSHADNPVEHQMLLERIVRELKPVVALIPSLADDHPHRREAHRISRTAIVEVPTVLTYETATSTPDFRPTRFLDVSAYMDKKLEVLAAYRDSARPELLPGYVQAAARHWGRHTNFGEAEAFEVMREDGKDA